MKKAIVTGATGFIGSVFVETLLKRDIKVLALGRKGFEDISEIRQKKIIKAKYLKIEMSEIKNLKKMSSQFLYTLYNILSSNSIIV